RRRPTSSWPSPTSRASRSSKARSSRSAAPRTSPGPMPNGCWRRILKPGDYDFVYAGATTARAQALLSGAVDAAIVLPPSNFQLQAGGFNDLGLTIEYAPELAFSGTVANKAWAGRNPDVLKRVLAAQAKSI